MPRRPLPNASSDPICCHEPPSRPPSRSHRHHGPGLAANRGRPQQQPGRQRPPIGADRAAPARSTVLGHSDLSDSVPGSSAIPARAREAQRRPVPGRWSTRPRVSRLWGPAPQPRWRGMDAVPTRSMVPRRRLHATTTIDPHPDVRRPRCGQSFGVLHAYPARRRQKPCYARNLAARLKREGYAVDAAQDGEEGLYMGQRCRSMSASSTSACRRCPAWT